MQKQHETLKFCVNFMLFLTKKFKHFVENM